MKIAHITDPHLRENLPGTARVNSRLSRRMAGLLGSAAEILRTERPDLVVVSGDLLDHPSYGLNDPELRRRGLMDLSLIRDVVEGIGCPYAVVHGNHDHPELVQDVFGSRDPSPLDEILVDGHRVILFHDDEVEANVPQRMGGERNRFLRVVDEAGAPQIHVQHFVVRPELREGYPHSYREAGELGDRILRSGNVRLVLSGHYHRGVEPFREGDTWFSTAPSFAEPPHCLRLYDLDGSDLTWRDVSIADDDPELRPAVFLDRDGNINPQPSYRTGPEDFELIPGAANAQRRLKDAGYELVVVSNQTCVGLGWVTAETVGAVMDRMSLMLQDEAGVDVDGVYSCHHCAEAVLPEWHHPDPPDLKPNPGMLLRAAEIHGIDLARSFMVGDSVGDVGAGRNAGTGTVLVRTGAGHESESRLPPGSADAVVDDISAAADWILAQS